jgi:hypothetical protein
LHPIVNRKISPLPSPSLPHTNPIQNQRFTLSLNSEGFSAESLWALVFVSIIVHRGPAHANSIRRYGINHALMRRCNLDQQNLFRIIDGANVTIFPYRATECTSNYKFGANRTDLYQRSYKQPLKSKSCLPDFDTTRYFFNL